MSDPELEAIRRNKLRELQRRLHAPKKIEETDANGVLDRIFTGRAWEVFKAADLQFPTAMRSVRDVLVDLARSGRLTEITGEQLYVFLRNLGLRVRLVNKIRFVEHGELKSISEKVKESLRKA